MRTFNIHCVLIAVCTALAGCQSVSIKEHFDLTQPMPWMTSSERRDEPPGRLVGFWMETIRHKKGEQPLRGFGGRIYFYGTDDEEPIEVEGQLVVYAFDEDHRDPTDNRPTRRYVFPPEQFSLHYSESEMGDSYSFWLPWGDTSGPQKQISLIARFEPLNGPTIVSQQTSHRLPGTLPEISAQTQQRAEAAKAIMWQNAHKRGAVQPAGYAATPGSPLATQTTPSAAAVNQPLLGVPTKMQTTSIPLPSRVRRPVPSAVAARTSRSRGANLSMTGSSTPQQHLPTRSLAPATVGQTGSKAAPAPQTGRRRARSGPLTRQALGEPIPRPAPVGARY